MIRFMVAPLLLLLLLVSSVTPESTPRPEPKVVCLFCEGLLDIPQTDDDAQVVLKFACDSIENQLLAGACRTLASAIHTTHTWPAFKWFLEKIKGPACALLCPA
uniref:Saposin B-type domain-containing protein n=1 Tax=Caenorhabditis tropicalis TaxID=1561998 RepID=A0A1I7U4Y3_9PELO